MPRGRPSKGTQEGLEELTTAAGRMTSSLALEPPERRMSQVSCPKCSTLVKQGGFPAWQIIIAILFFPLGMLALLAGRKPTTCSNCGFRFQT